MTNVSPGRGGNIQLGDYVLKAGIYSKPGVVVEKQESGNVVIDTDPEAIKMYHRHTNTTGLSPEEKDMFNQIMDSVQAAESNGDKINQLQKSIDEVKIDPKNRRVAETLRNEQASLIRLSKELPRVYTMEEKRLR